mmetsp:Transcript_31081/g.29668  ORF Transcript_31081/g.29668 Transcript_31081/m.29668 type:complete len:232 (+) Transcript_31081:101-796(+)|eukprot:CAMPEP_0119042476 /NCGR_PEP_ID=MMETSP1177-20130426/15363_1 /TAXON_ID=2985 /ORGANISM="Ochromonas sp, Strain CCMP1899" /LENGTH=231 /DNA_ID=CAMNT_0007009303 /DNA_START=86 /DNA_END=781 /DNA_ORIENTATION=+
MFRFLTTLAIIGSALAYTAPVRTVRSNIALNAKSQSVPFLEQPAALTGTLPGDVGFDPLGFTAQWADKDWSQQIVPDTWDENAAQRTPVTTIEWMREAELKHGRVAMLAVLGWVVVDSGLRMPGSGYESITSSFAAHDAAVANGSMGFLLLMCGVAELTSGAAIFDQAKGSGRTSGDFSFDPLNLGKDLKKKERYAVSEVKNGRLAMLAISGILTQQATFPDQTFPFLSNF